MVYSPSPHTEANQERLTEVKRRLKQWQRLTEELTEKELNSEETVKILGADMGLDDKVKSK